MGPCTWGAALESEGWPLASEGTSKRSGVTRKVDSVQEEGRKDWLK